MIDSHVELKDGMDEQNTVVARCQGYKVDMRRAGVGRS